MKFRKLPVLTDYEAERVILKYTFGENLKRVKDKVLVYKSMQKLHNALIEEFGTSEGCEIYRKLKSLKQLGIEIG